MNLEEKVDALGVQVQLIREQVTALQEQMAPLTNFKIGITAIAWAIAAICTLGGGIAAFVEIFRK